MGKKFRIKVPLAATCVMVALFLALALAGCRKVEDFQSARLRMVSDLSALKALLGETAPEATEFRTELSKDSYLLGRVIQAVAAYKTDLKIAADASTLVLLQVRKAKASGAEPADPQFQAKFHEAFNRNSYDLLYVELLEVQTVLDAIQGVCLAEPYSRNCTAFGALVAPMVHESRLLQRNFVDLIEL
jgi:hypothetical protein